MGCNKEVSESSASTAALFKEEMSDDGIPKKISVGDVWMNLHKSPPKQSRQLEAADQQDTLMGRLASRMAARDMIDELDLGPKGRAPTAKKAVVADNDIPRPIRVEGPAVEKKLKKNETSSSNIMGPGLHQQMSDVKASNFSNPIPEGKVTPGANMADQAKYQGNVYNTMNKVETTQQKVLGKLRLK